MNVSRLNHYSLPFYDEHSCALGVVVMTYLNELSAREDPTLDSTREEMKTKCQTWVEYCDLPTSLNDAFELWDAVRKSRNFLRFPKESLIKTLGFKRSEGCRKGD